MLQFIQFFLQRLLPYTCHVCGRPADQPLDLCRACFADLPILTHSCVRCANILPALETSLLCGQCLLQPPAYDRAFAQFVYQPPISTLICDLKFRFVLSAARLLGELLSAKIKQDWYQHESLPQAIIPIPLHFRRLKERGFNQALEISRPIAHALGLPLLTDVCARNKATLPQATLKISERRTNMRDAFVIKKNINFQHIAVIDDIITTGQTMENFCLLLRNYGIKK